MRKKQPLFSHDFSATKTNQQLQELIQSYPGLDSYYIASGSIRERRRYFESLWEDFWALADDHFLSQVQLDFNSRSWEMYLAHVLKLHGYLPTSAGKGPDLIISGEMPTYIEAIAVNRGTGPDAVPPTFYGVATFSPDREIALRLTNAFDVKMRKFNSDVKRGYIEERSHKIIAINSGLITHFPAYTNRMIQVCFGLGDPVMSVTLEGGEVGYSLKETPSIQKGNVQISSRLFLDPDHSHISAVIYSETDVLNSAPYLGKELTVIHNPLAKYPLPVTNFSRFTQWHPHGGEMKKIDPS